MLFTQGYVKNIPGAPMCGCVEQIPVVGKADCVEPIEGYTIDNETGEVQINLTWKDCGDLTTYYDTLDKHDAEKMYLKTKIAGTDDGNCKEAGASFMNERMYVPKAS